MFEKVCIEADQKVASAISKKKIKNYKEFSKIIKKKIIKIYLGALTPYAKSPSAGCRGIPCFNHSDFGGILADPQAKCFKLWKNNNNISSIHL